MEKVVLPPEASSVIESMRSLGYSFHDAVADIVDNSVSAGAENVDVMCDYDCPEPYLSVFDDGCGMTDSELRKALTFGSKNPLNPRAEDDLGRFGLGLKVASLSQCSKLTVLSRKDGEINGYCWDLDNVRGDNEWCVLRVDAGGISGMQIERLSSSETGTLVVWQNFDILKKGSSSISESLRVRLNNTRDHLSLVFHRYIARKGQMADARNLTITVNNMVLKPRDPFLTSNSLTIPRVDQSFSYHGKRVDVRGYILPHIDKLTGDEIEELGGRGKLQQLQGFYVYRNKRLIMPGGTWFKLKGRKQLQNLARVMIDLPNDLDVEWSVDVKKSSVNVPEDFKDKLGAVLQDVLSVSTRVYQKRGTVSRDSENRIIVRRDCKDYVTYEINREHPAIASMLSNPEVSLQFSAVLTMIEKSIPYDDIRNDFEEKLTRSELTKDESDAILMMGVRLLEFGLSLDELSSKDPYCFYPELIEILREKGYK